MMAGQYEYIFRYYGVRPVIGGRVEHTVTHEFGTILKEGGSNLHYVRVQFDRFADPSFCHPMELDFLAPDEVEGVAIVPSDVEPRQPAQQDAACEDEQAKPGDAHHLDPQRIKTSAFCSHGREESRGRLHAATKPKGCE